MKKNRSNGHFDCHKASDSNCKMYSRLKTFGISSSIGQLNDEWNDENLSVAPRTRRGQTPCQRIYINLFTVFKIDFFNFINCKLWFIKVDIAPFFSNNELSAGIISNKSFVAIIPIYYVRAIIKMFFFCSNIN